MTTPPTLQTAARGLSVLLCVWLSTTHAARAADDAALQRCRAITEAGARLACYDALPLGGTPLLQTAPAPALAPPRGLAPAASPAVTPSAAAPTVAAAVAPSAVQSFGQERRDEPQAISSHIVGVFEGWGPTSRIKLANGQVWQVVDGSDGVYYLQNPKVTVKRALMGGFLLDVEGAKRTPRVRRVE